MGLIITIIGCTMGAADNALPGSYLMRTVNAMEACRADIAGMQKAVEAAADRLANGGKFWLAGQPSMVSELSPSSAVGFQKIYK